MTNEELIQSIAKNTEYTQFDVRSILNELSHTVTTALLNEESVSITGIGKFEVVNRPSKEGIIKVGKNKGEKWYKPARKVPTFRIANDLKQLKIS